MNYAWALRVSYETSFNAEVLCGCRLLERLYLPTDCMMSSSIGAAKSGLRWMNMERTTTARPRVSSSYSSSTAAQSRHLGYHIAINQAGLSINITDLEKGIAADWFIHLSDIVVGCSSMNSSGAGTNMLTVLGAESRLVFVGPSKEMTEQEDLGTFSVIRCWLRSLRNNMLACLNQCKFRCICHNLITSKKRYWGYLTMFQD